MTILCYGDSNTYGYDPRSWLGDRYPADSRWVDILGDMTGWNVLNRGQNGREIPQHPRELEQAERMLRANAPVEVLAVMLGTNDLLQGNLPRQVRERMEVFLRRARPLCEKLLLIAPPELRRGGWVSDDSLVERSRRLREEYRALAAELNISFADAGTWDVEIGQDGVHFTEAGHRAFAAGLAALLGDGRAEE